ncbi:DUF4376 domain-containing protein [Pyramidobacter piscolens]|uniref:DUF4376 domain-containing protein n=1 Tax=Pyramidobacter piscolens TaxID=638849 RepID=UPI001FCAFEDA|nr:DUF4376 domain-containing protein [Pyramidobacter piscolens]BDF77890.1 hypothetical protein CE91St28_06840 [Pyramidobacter piscolens]BDF78675.1 hypothetical protein CE91St28_14690 [Pyramidobacter piscolens]
MIGTKIDKTDFDAEVYASTAEWCNANGARIEDKGDCYEVVAILGPTLDELKAAKRTEIIAARDAAVREGATWQGHPIYTDADAQRLALSVMAAPTLAAAVGSPETVPYPTWTCKDGFVIQLDEAYATDLCLTIQTYVTAMYNTAAELLTQVGAAQSADDLAAIAWPEELG